MNKGESKDEKGFLLICAIESPIENNNNNNTWTAF